MRSPSAMFELDPVVEDAENAQPSGGQLGLSKNGAHLQRVILIGTIVILIYLNRE